MTPATMSIDDKADAPAALYSLPQGADVISALLQQCDVYQLLHMLCEMNKRLAAASEGLQSREKQLCTALKVHCLDTLKMELSKLSGQRTCPRKDNDEQDVLLMDVEDLTCTAAETTTSIELTKSFSTIEIALLVTQLLYANKVKVLETRAQDLERDIYDDSEYKRLEKLYEQLQEQYKALQEQRWSEVEANSGNEVYKKLRELRREYREAVSALREFQQAQQSQETKEPEELRCSSCTEMEWDMEALKIELEQAHADIQELTHAAQKKSQQYDTEREAMVKQHEEYVMDLKEDAQCTIRRLKANMLKRGVSKLPSLSETPSESTQAKCQQLTVQYSDMKKIVASYSDEIEMLRMDRKREIEAQLLKDQTLEAKCKEYERAAKDGAAHLKNAQERLEQQKAKCNAERQQLETVITDYRMKVTSLERTIRELEEKVVDAASASREEDQQNKSAIASLQQTVDKHRKAAEQSRKELKKCEVQIASLQQTCNVLIKQTKPRDAELSALEAECKSLREALAKQKETLILSDEEAKKLVSYQERLQYMEATKLGLQKALAEERRKVLEQESIIKTLKVVHDAQRTKMAQIQDALKGII